MPLLRKEKQKIQALVVLLIFHLLLISLQVPLSSRPSFLERAVFQVFSPLQHGVAALFRTMGNLWTGYFYLVNLKKQNSRMQKKLFVLQQENTFLKSDLEAALGRKDIERALGALGSSVLAASVIGMDPSTFYRSLVIDKGSLDGVRKDTPVLDRSGNLVGRVVAPVSLKEAFIQIITDEDSGVGVYIEGEKGVGVVSGDGKGTCTLKYILDTNEDVAVGDVVFTSGFDGIYPRGIPVGRILKLSSKGALFKDITVEPFFRFRELSRLAVLRPGRSDESVGNR